MGAAHSSRAVRELTVSEDQYPICNVCAET